MTWLRPENDFFFYWDGNGSADILSFQNHALTWPSYILLLRFRVLRGSRRICDSGSFPFVLVSYLLPFHKSVLNGRHSVISHKTKFLVICLILIDLLDCKVMQLEVIQYEFCWEIFNYSPAHFNALS